MRFTGTSGASVYKRVFDNFNRTTGVVLGPKNALGTTTVGNKTWNEPNGKWFADGTSATSETASAAYPVVAYVNMDSTNLVASVSTSGPGTGVVFSYISSSLWYAAVNTATANSYTTGCQQGCYYCQYQNGTTSTANTCYYCDGFTWGFTSTAGYCQNGGYGASSTYGCYGGSVCTQNPGCTGFVTGSWINGTSTANCNTGQSAAYCGSTSTPTYTSGYNCSACGSYEYGCQTGYTPAYYFRLIKYENGTISDLVTGVQISAPPVAIKVNVFGSTVTATAYSDAAMTTVRGTPLTATITPPVPYAITGRTGIVMVPTEYPSPIVDNFSAQP